MHLNLSKIINDSNYVYVIGEIGLNHNGSIDLAKELIDVAKQSGCDAVKFQKRTVEKLATKEILDAKDDRFPDFGKTYKEIRNFLEFDFQEYKILKNYAEKNYLDFFVTAFDEDAVDFLEKLDTQIYKIASHSLTNLNLLNYISKKNKPVIMSTGMSNLSEIESAVSLLVKKVPLYLMHCISAYPTPEEDCNIKVIDLLMKTFNLPVGYSGHEVGYFPTLIAVARGARLVERHITLDKKMQGFDHKISLEPNELKSMVSEIRLAQKILGTGDRYVSQVEMITRNKYHVSMVTSCPIKKGTKITPDMIVYRNPGTGISQNDSHKILGKVAIVDIDQDVILKTEMISE